MSVAGPTVLGNPVQLMRTSDPIQLPAAAPVAPAPVAAASIR
jgi:hypothetical protein